MDSSRNTFQVEADIARAWTLPAHLYWDADILLAEKEKIFSRTWQVVGHASQVANPGDFFTTELIGEPLLLVRGRDGKLCAASTTSAAIAPDLPRRDAAHANYFAAATTDGPTLSTARCSAATEIEGVEGLPRGRISLSRPSAPKNGSISSL